jgi:predicted NUDIX family NTP pyrophosphohydrolase
MSKTSAGLLMFRQRAQTIEVLLVHPGGPFWAKKDEGAWSIPKGEYKEGEEPLTAAIREFSEETGLEAHGPFIPLKPLIQSRGKLVSAWALEGEGDLSSLRSNLFSMEWPPRSGRSVEFPEVDRAAWFDLGTAMRKILKGQVGFLEELRSLLKGEEVKRYPLLRVSQ